jgi:uncharacterized protein YjbI with pentapeptide repeats
MALRHSLFALAAIASLPAGAAAQDASPEARTVWEIPLGAHARELPTETFTEYACGTRGGPPSAPIGGWADFAKCPSEADTGLHEVYFRYDDEAEYVARARSFEDQVAVYNNTRAHDVPIIVSLLFDADGFVVGYRIVSDPRVDTALREIGSDLAGPLMARFGEDQFACEDLDPAAGESAYQGMFIKRHCHAENTRQGLDFLVRAHRFRKTGQTAIIHGEVTEGLFESTTFFQAVLSEPVADREARLAALPEPEPTEKQLLIERARNCPGCDLRGVDLKRADLSGANLAGADLSGANLHGAILRRADLTGTIFVSANLNRADLRLATVTGGVLAGSMLYAAQLDGADLSGGILNGIRAGKATWARANVSNAYLINSDLHDARLNDADFRATNLSGARLNDVQMTRTDLEGAVLAGASLWRASLVAASLKGVDAQGADLFGANLREADLSGANFGGARMTSAIMTAARTDGASFAGAQLPPGFSTRPQPQ